MTDIYSILKPKKGYAYKEKSIVSYSLVKQPIPSGKKIKGNSRIWGDIDEQNFKAIVDIIISLGSRFNLNYKEIAHTLLICAAESGFNPDAAAGTTSAAGLAQYTADTVKAFKDRSKSVLGVEIDMTGKVFDATIGCYGVLVAFIFNRNLAVQWGFKPENDNYWQLIYYLHHDGPGYYNDDRGKERAQNFKFKPEAVDTYARVFKPLDTLTELLKGQKVETKVKLTDVTGAPISNKNYILAAPKAGNATKPSHLSMNKANKIGFDAIFGKTNANGETNSIYSKIGDEIVTMLLPDDFKKHLKTTSNENYKIKRGDSLEKIAKAHKVTVKQLQQDNKIANKDEIKAGDTLIISHKYLKHKPANSTVNDIFEQLGFTGFNKNILTYSQNHTAKPQNSTSNSKDKSQSNTIGLQSPVKHDDAKSKKQENPKAETATKQSGDNKSVAVNITDGMAVIYTFIDTNYNPPAEAPKKGYTVFYDHLGNKLISFKSGNKVSHDSEPDADGNFNGYFVKIDGGYRNSDQGKGYGTTKIRTTDARWRWIHGGGSRFKSHAFDERQGWAVTKGCTRGQNIDVENLAAQIREFQKKYPKVKIRYIRDRKGTYPQ